MKTTNTKNSGGADATATQPGWMQYVPQGSYLLTSKAVNILIQGVNTFDSKQAVPVTYSEGMAEGIEDISNDNGVLKITPGNGTIPNPTQNGPFLPAGSYSIVTTQIVITITAYCANVHGQYLVSKVVYTQAQAAALKDIINVNGVLTLGF